MADVTGPISTLPGSRHKVPDGTVCDEHPEKLAVVRKQGETDSFGAELYDLCQECVDQEKARAEEAAKNPEPNWCDHCKAFIPEPVTATRDPEEGTCGPVYHLCTSHRKSLFDNFVPEYDGEDDYYDPDHLDD